MSSCCITIATGWTHSIVQQFSATCMAWLRYLFFFTGFRNPKTTVGFIKSRFNPNNPKTQLNPGLCLVFFNLRSLVNQFLWQSWHWAMISFSCFWFSYADHCFENCCLVTCWLHHVRRKVLRFFSVRALDYFGLSAVQTLLKLSEWPNLRSSLRDFLGMKSQLNSLIISAWVSSATLVMSMWW